MPSPPFHRNRWRSAEYRRKFGWGANGYYRRASLDGSRPAIYFINLKSTGDWPK